VRADLGMSEERICAYPRTEWMTDDEFKTLTKAVYVNCKKSVKAKEAPEQVLVLSIRST
jgi:hypothetical protein